MVRGGGATSGVQILIKPFAYYVLSGRVKLGPTSWFGFQMHDMNTWI